MKILILVIIVLVFQQYIELADGVSCASNPCNLVPGIYDAVTGYCCTDIGPTFTDSVCSCPNNATPVINAPCRVGPTPAPLICNRTCLNNGVCNIVNNQDVCWCTLGYAGPNCELQAIAGRCAQGACVAGTCFEQTIGATIFAYCQCNPGWTGQRCDTCFFQCSQAGAFSDPPNCITGRYFYCPQASGAPVAATCPAGQRFNRITNFCDPAFNCT